MEVNEKAPQMDHSCDAECMDGAEPVVRNGRALSLILCI